MDGPDDPPVAAVPERLDRHLRLGPFPSARDALKFATYAAVGAVLVPVLGVGVGLGVGAAGFVVAVWHPDDRALDERAVTYLAWTVRRKWGAGAMTPAAPSARVGGALARLDDGRIAAVVQAGGIPLAYLPPGELARRFEQYRDLLRSVDGPIAVTSTWANVLSTPFRPAAIRPGAPDAGACGGYTELVEVLARRRRLRRVYVVLSTADPGPEGIGRLEAGATLVVDRLTAIGLRPERLRGPALRTTARRLGWSEAEGTG